MINELCYIETMFNNDVYSKAIIENKIKSGHSGNLISYYQSQKNKSNIIRDVHFTTKVYDNPLSCAKLYEINTQTGEIIKDRYLCGLNDTYRACHSRKCNTTGHMDCYDMRNNYADIHADELYMINYCKGHSCILNSDGMFQREWFLDNSLQFANIHNDQLLIISKNIVLDIYGYEDEKTHELCIFI